MKIHLVQISDQAARRVALVVEPHLRCLTGVSSVYELAQQCLRSGTPFSKTAQSLANGESLLYADVYGGTSRWRLLSPIDVPEFPCRLLVSGTGLTHLGSARERQAMHIAGQSKDVEVVTDSMRMFRWGIENGRPADGQVGIAPEWFYKGDGSIVRAPFEALQIPFHAEDGGEEAELAGVYLVGDDGMPYRLGMANGNEFSDHKFEKRNYLNLAGSKLRSRSLGPELVVDANFDNIRGEVRIERAGAILWQKSILTGEQNMCHSLANLEYHHFKFAGHRQPGQLHIHFFGADGLSFGDNIVVRDGDVAEVRFQGFGRALRNPTHQEVKPAKPIRVRSLD